MAKRLKIGLLCPYPPEELHQGYYALNIIKNTNADFVKIGTLNSNSDYKLNFKSFFLKEMLKKIIEKEKIDILHIQYIPPFFGSRYLNLNLLRVYSLKIPIITTLHEVYFQAKKSIKNMFLRFLERNIVNHSKQIIVHNYMMADFLKKEHKQEIKNFSSLKSSKLFKQTEKINTIILGHYPKKEHKRAGKNILFFGILSPGKGVEYLIKAMQYLKDYRLKVIGSIPNKICDDYKKKLLKELKKSNLKNIEIKTKKWFSEDEKNDYHKKTEIIILPYIWGPYNSAVVQDAVENGLPLVVTKVGAIYDLVGRFRLGVVVKPKNPKEIAEAVKKCFKDYSIYKDNVRKFRKQVSWKENGEKHLRVYKKVVK